MDKRQKKKVKNKELDDNNRMMRALIKKNKRMESIFTIMSEAIDNAKKADIEDDDEDHIDDDDDEQNMDDYDESILDCNESQARMNSTPITQQIGDGRNKRGRGGGGGERGGGKR